MRFQTTTRFRPLLLPMPDAVTTGAVSPPPPPPPANGEWYKGASDEVKQYVERNKFPDVVTALQSGMNAEKMIGVPADQVIRRPAQGYEIDPKPYTAALRTLGAPEKGEAYPADKLFAPVDGLGQIAPELQKTVTGKFAELGILPWQAQGLMGMFTEISKSQKTTMDAADAAAATERQGRLDAFKAERGAKFDGDVKGARALIAKFDRPIAGEAEALKAKGMLRTDGKGVILQDAAGKPIPKGEYEHYLDETGQGDDPALIRLLSSIAERFDPSSLTSDPGRTGDTPGSMTKAQAQAELIKLRGNPGWMKAFTTRSHPEHGAAVAKNLELEKIANS